MRGLWRLLITMIMMLVGAPTGAAAGVVLKLGDILVAEPGTASISVIDPATGAKTVISQGGLLSPPNKTVGVAFAPDGDVIVVHRTTGLIRVNPVTEQQSILSQGGLFRDPWAIAIDKDTGYIYVADSGYDNDRPEINEAGKIIRVDPVSGAQQLIASGSPCNFFPANAACQNTTSAGSYLAHPYGIAIDYTIVPGTLVVADMSSFNGKGRHHPYPAGSEWHADAVVGAGVRRPGATGRAIVSTWMSDGCRRRAERQHPDDGLHVSRSRRLLHVPPPAGTFYGCAPPGIFRVDLTSNVQTVVNANAPPWQPNHAYAVGDVIRDDAPDSRPSSRDGRDLTELRRQAGTARRRARPSDGSVVWQNIGLGANWLIPFGLAVEPAPTPSDPSRYNIIVADEGYSMVFRLDADGHFLSPAPLATNISNVTSVDVITFTPPGGFSRRPARFNGQPAGTLPAGTTQTTLGLTTDENATCRYSTQPGVAYASMTNTFTTTGSTSHATIVTGLTNGSSYVLRPLRGRAWAMRTRTTSSSRSPWRARPRRPATSPGRRARCPRAACGIRRAPGPIFERTMAPLRLV